MTASQCITLAITPLAESPRSNHGLGQPVRSSKKFQWVGSGSTSAVGTLDQRHGNAQRTLAHSKIPIDKTHLFVNIAVLCCTGCGTIYYAGCFINSHQWVGHGHNRRVFPAAHVVKVKHALHGAVLHTPDDSTSLLCEEWFSRAETSFHARQLHLRLIPAHGRRWL